jgi:hypothetical protein
MVQQSEYCTNTINEARGWGCHMFLFLSRLLRNGYWPDDVRGFLLWLSFESSDIVERLVIDRDISVSPAMTCDLNLDNNVSVVLGCSLPVWVVFVWICSGVFSSCERLLLIPKATVRMRCSSEYELQLNDKRTLRKSIHTCRGPRDNLKIK